VEEMNSKTIVWAVALGLLVTGLGVFISILTDDIYLSTFKSYVIDIPNPGNLVAVSSYAGIPFPYLFSASAIKLQFGPVAFIFDFVIFFAIFLGLLFVLERTTEKKKAKKRIAKQELRYGRRKIKRR
jgi:hypothetical protein